MPTTTPTLTRHWRLGGPLALGLALVACASTPRPDAALAAAASSVEAARAANAGELAAPEMDAARQKLERARALAQVGRHQEALMLAEQADADAQLARARAGSQRSRLALEEVESGLRTLREELQRRPSTGGNPPAPAGAPQPVPPLSLPIAPPRSAP